MTELGIGMNADILELIKKECEKIETETGFGKVLISIENGCVKVVQPTSTILLPKPLDKKLK